LTITPQLRLPGRVNLANAAMALAAANVMGVEPEVAAKALARVEDVDGRYIQTRQDGRDLRLLLGKNPASWTELIDMVATSGRELVIAINARGADGRDPSWLWDVPFERLAGRSVQAAGERRYDLAVRLDLAGVTVTEVVEDPLMAAANCSAGAAVDIVANYTAFQNLRSRVVR
jgi:UDP-N-acetylmuramyl tripeptide synthase